MVKSRADSLWPLLISFLLWLQEDQSHGEIVLDLEGGKIFSVAQHQNDPNLNFLCLESKQVELYHRGDCLKTLDCVVSQMFLLHVEVKVKLMLGNNNVGFTQKYSSGGERHAHPTAAGDAQIHAPQAP